MIIDDLMRQKHISKYRLAKMTNIPYTTINDLINENSNFKKSSVENIDKIAKALGVTVEYLMEYQNEERVDFDLFKSYICHCLKEMTDIGFMIDLLESDEIRRYEQKKWYPECLYLLAMLDYLSRVNDFPYVEEYDDLRVYRLKETIYPSSILVLDKVLKDRNIKEEALNESIPEFRRFNIVESEIRNVI